MSTDIKDPVANPIVEQLAQTALTEKQKKDRLRWLKEQVEFAELEARLEVAECNIWTARANGIRARIQYSQMMTPPEKSSEETKMEAEFKEASGDQVKDEQGPEAEPQP